MRFEMKKKRTRCPVRRTRTLFYLSFFFFKGCCSRETTTMFQQDAFLYILLAHRETKPSQMCSKAVHANHVVIIIIIMLEIIIITIMEPCEGRIYEKRNPKYFFHLRHHNKPRTYMIIRHHRC